LSYFRKFLLASYSFSVENGLNAVAGKNKEIVKCFHDSIQPTRQENVFFKKKKWIFRKVGNQ
jgi:hypothetical protein